MNINKTTNINSKTRSEIIKDVKSYIGTRGYIIKKKYLTEKELNEIREENTVKPFVTNDYGAEEEPFKIYLESENKLYLPKFYGLERFGNPEANVLPEGTDIDIDFSLTLKEEQKIPAQHTIKAYEDKGGGILSLPCGFGKTILALYFISKLKKRTMVIVHKEFLMNQWIERIKFALPSAKIGIVQANKCQIEGYDIIIGMLQTLSMREFPENTFDTIGHVIIDECHRIPSKVFSKALMKINSKYMLGLSATPNRKDGLTKVLKYNIGDIIYSVKSHDKNIVKVNRYLLNSEDESYNKSIYNFKGSAQSSTMINNIARCRNRTELIVQIIIEEINKNDKRQILVLSDRREHLDEICSLSKLKGLESVGYYVGGMKKEKLKESESCKLILGTYPMAKEGLDIPSLNGLILATPISDIVQSIGRIDRIKHMDITPLIIDIVDKFSIYENQARKRFALFKKKKYQIEDIQYNLDNMKKGISKNYFYHNIKGEDSEESDENEMCSTKDSDEDNSNNIKSNIEIKKKTTQTKMKTIKIDKNMSNKDIDDLFKQYAFTS
jgi:superfamily II DNA or RNA helicase